jgi:hypothetical protein
VLAEEAGVATLLFAVQRFAPGHWLVRALDANPCLPVVRVVAVLDERSLNDLLMLRRLGSQCSGI